MLCKKLKLTNNELQNELQNNLLFGKYWHRLNTDLHNFEDVVGGAADTKAWPLCKWVHHAVEAVPWSEWRVQEGWWLSVGDGWLAVDLDLQKTEKTFLDVNGPVLVCLVCLDVTNFAFRQPAPSSSSSSSS